VTWKPLLEGDLAARACDAIRAIAVDVEQAHPRGPTLSAGDAGLALFFAYQARSGGNAGDQRADAGESCLERAMDTVAEVPLPVYLHGGFTGVAWAVEHLVGSGDAADDANAEVDDALADEVSRWPLTGSYDLIRGLTGLGVYALERGQRPVAENLLDSIVARLAALAEPAAAGVTIWTPAHDLIPESQVRHPHGYYNLGVAHGVPGVIGFLGSVATDEARRLREGLTDWMSSARSIGPDGSLYPYTIDRRHRRPNGGCRAAWCYGDPGIAAALLRGARAAGDARLEQLALEAGHAAASRALDQSGVVDAGLCHGAAGLMHVFNRLYQATGASAFHEAAVRWAAETLAMRGEGVGGYRAYQAHGAGGDRVADPSMLTGAAGIGLALLAATTDVEPRWDIALLCDVPPL
jgi:lantibiotic modifying enzyme